MRVTAGNNEVATAATTRGYYSNKNTTKRKSIPRATAAPTSPVAMGKALVLLATSCAALSGGHPVATTRRGGCVASRSRPRRVRHQGALTLTKRRGGNGESRTSSALRYRDGDEDQLLDQPADPRTAGTAGTGTKARAGIHFNILTFAMPSVSIPRMPTAPAPTKEEQEQLVMDEYLEFVERRYRSMHPGHHQRRQPRPQRKHHSTPRRVALDQRLPRKILLLSKLSWHQAAPLTLAPTAAAATMRQEAPSQGPGREPLEEEEEEEENPLKILGLSNLASERLRQRLHAPRHWRDEATLLKGATEFVTYCVNTRRPMFVPNGLPPKNTKAASKAMPQAASTSTAPATTEEAAAAADGDGGRASAYVALSFPAQLRLLLASLMRVAGILVAFARRACEEVLHRGGFRSTVRLAGAASVAVLLAFRPLLPGSLKQG